MFGDLHLFDGAALGTVGGAVVGVLVYEFFHYWYHRSAHRFDALWRLGHQMHHSAESLDAWGAYYLHPIDAALFTSLSSLVLFPLLGLTPEAGALGGGGAHLLRRVPARRRAHAALARLHVQRPESHAIHHAARRACLQLRRPAAVGHGVRHLPQPAGRRTGRAQGFYDGASARIARDARVPRRVAAGATQAG